MYDRHESISKPGSSWHVDIEPAPTPPSPGTRSPSPTLTDQCKPVHRRFASHLQSNISSGSVTYPSIYMCFLTGLTAAPSFAACFVWCGFQTGNAAQLGLALARTFTPDHQRTFGFQKMDQQALVSLLSFLVGSSLGQIGNKVGGKKRYWLVLATFIQMVLMMIAALIGHFSGESGLADGRGDPSWVTPMGMTTLAFLSATMGLQGAVGLRLGSPMATTVPLTSTWIDIFNDPFLFALRAVRTRDIRCAGALSLIFGAFVSRAMLGVIGSSGTIGVVIGFRAILLGWWFFLPNDESNVEQSQPEPKAQLPK
ncbi:hypothetical protein I302_108847 [Kwoniella bestiolae CBS 10118]|uniref:DUF1275 domain-containing protein n=1 Tax=Kwoniella bestiolae CBS 10118 TaxID=1296100 RepID=A0A1B9FU87_9TREE|nr:hypothetical protein I302_07986 [Kwoniella bestiolae CBS 10118]OCF22339.1 hypothetical protein I302_07986 [Kwoniella bestiolae CBS 10118]